MDTLQPFSGGKSSMDVISFKCHENLFNKVTVFQFKIRSNGKREVSVKKLSRWCYNSRKTFHFSVLWIFQGLKSLRTDCLQGLSHFLCGKLHGQDHCQSPSGLQWGLGSQHLAGSTSSPRGTLTLLFLSTLIFFSSDGHKLKRSCGI